MSTDYRKKPEYQRGIEVFKAKYSKSHWSLLDKLYDFSPELADIVIGHGLCDIWENKTPALSIKEKELITLSSLITSGVATTEIKAHAFNCLNVGVTEVQLKQLLVHLTLYVGVPLVIAAMPVVQEAIVEFQKK